LKQGFPKGENDVKRRKRRKGNKLRESRGRTMIAWIGHSIRKISKISVFIFRIEFSLNFLFILQ